MAEARGYRERSLHNPRDRALPRAFLAEDRNVPENDLLHDVLPSSVSLSASLKGLANARAQIIPGVPSPSHASSCPFGDPEPTVVPSTDYTLLGPSPPGSFQQHTVPSLDENCGFVMGTARGDPFQLPRKCVACCRVLNVVLVVEAIHSSRYHLTGRLDHSNSHSLPFTLTFTLTFTPSSRLPSTAAPPVSESYSHRPATTPCTPLSSHSAP